MKTDYTAKEASHWINQFCTLNNRRSEQNSWLYSADLLFQFFWSPKITTNNATELIAMVSFSRHHRPLLRFVCGSSRRQGRSPSSVAGTYSKRRSPGRCTPCLVCWSSASRRTCAKSRRFQLLKSQKRSSREKKTFSSFSTNWSDQHGWVSKAITIFRRITKELFRMLVDLSKEKHESMSLQIVG